MGIIAACSWTFSRYRVLELEQIDRSVIGEMNEEAREDVRNGPMTENSFCVTWKVARHPGAKTTL